MRKKRFFIHYNKPETQRKGKVQVSVHFNKICHIVDNVVCNVESEGKVNKTQPYFVMQGKATSVIVRNNIAIII